MHKLAHASKTTDLFVVIDIALHISDLCCKATIFLSWAEDHLALSHSLVEDCRPMAVTEAEADETRKHPLTKRLNSLQPRNTCDSEELAALEGW